MGKQKYLNQISSLFEKSPIVNYSSIEKIINDKKKVKQYTKQVIRNLIIKRKIFRLTKGYYTSINDASLFVLCFKETYLGLQDALSFHDIWEQETIPVIITSKKIRQGLRKVLGTNVLIRRISRKYLFGFDHYNQDKFYLPYSDVEKTFIDMIYFNEKLSEEALKNMKKRLNIKKLNFYLKKYPKKFRVKVLNLL